MSEEVDCQRCGGHALLGRVLCRGCLYWTHIGKLEDAVIALRESGLGKAGMTEDQRAAWDALLALVAKGTHE